MSTENTVIDAPETKVILPSKGEDKASLGKLIHDFSDMSKFPPGEAPPINEGDGLFRSYVEVVTDGSPAPSPVTAPSRGDVQVRNTPPPRIAKRLPVTQPAFTSAEQRTLPNAVITTGLMKSGKDFILKKLGYTIFGLADPLYVLQKLFFGSDDKALSGARAFLQTVGQWGRGQVDEKYPLTPARALFLTMIANESKKKGSKFHEISNLLGVSWSEFGTADIWLNALVKRLQGKTAVPVSPEVTRRAVSNVRFLNEYERLKAEGMEHWHVMCSPQTRDERLRLVGLSVQHPQCNDTSEQFALGIDHDVMKTLQVHPKGARLKVIWCDDKVKRPSPRLWLPSELK